MKRTLSLVLALVMVLGTFTGVFAAEAENTAAEFLAEEGVLLGANGDLMLENNLERRDAVILLSRLLGVEDEAAEFLTTEDSPSWEDARTDAYYVPFFAWAEENGYFAGDDEGNFNPRNDITAPEFALVLIRALGYEANGHAPWKASLETAEELGLLKDVEVEFADLVVRGEMAIMIVNALNAKVNGTNETLADKLGIKLPEDPAATELTADVNDTENLVEVVVELSNADLAETERLERVSNYKLSDNNVKIKSATVVGDNVVLLLDLDNNNPSLVKGRSYTLTIRGIDKDINDDYKFKANDVTSPGIESVEVLGEYGIKVTTTEPVKDPQERNFLIDGKRMSMVVEQYGRDIILTPYYNVEFDEDATELTMLELEDYAGHKSSLIDEEIEVIHDEIAPEVVSVIRSREGKTVKVVFDKDIYIDSVAGYSNHRNVGNISYRDGRQTVYAEGIRNTADTAWVTVPADKIATNVVVYTFKDDLPRNVEFTIEGVENHSEIEMERISIVPTISLDEDAAEIVNNAKRIALNPIGNEVRLTIKFDKSVDISSIDSAYSNYFRLYEVDIRDEFNATFVNNVIKKVAYGLDKYGNILEDELVVTFVYDSAASATLELNSKARHDYILEITNLKDIYGNKIAKSYIDFEVVTSKALTVVNHVYASPVSSGETKFVIEFDRYGLPVDKADAEDVRNYVFATNLSGSVKRDLGQLNGEAIVDNDGYRVTLVVPERYSYVLGNYSGLELLPRVTATNGSRIANQIQFTLTSSPFMLIK